MNASTSPCVAHHVYATSADLSGAKAEVGDHVRRRRRFLGLTLVQLADATGLSHSFLSQVERGLAQPSMLSLHRVAAALGTSESSLMTWPQPQLDDGPALVRAEDGQAILNTEDDRRSGTSRTVAIAGSAEVREFRDGPNEFLEPYRHDGTEVLYVVTGRIEVKLEDGSPIMLRVGDSLTYRGTEAHQIRTLVAGTRFLMIHTP